MSRLCGVRRAGASAAAREAWAPSPSRRSKDVLAGGMVERVLLTEDVRQALAGVTQRKLPHRYAEAGLWYDALAVSADLVEAAPDDAALRRLHADLLAQVGLGHVAP